MDIVRSWTMSLPGHQLFQLNYNEPGCYQNASSATLWYCKMNIWYTLLMNIWYNIITIYNIYEIKENNHMAIMESGGNITMPLDWHRI